MIKKTLLISLLFYGNQSITLLRRSDQARSGEQVSPNLYSTFVNVTNLCTVIESGAVHCFQKDLHVIEPVNFKCIV